MRFVGLAELPRVPKKKPGNKPGNETIKHSPLRTRETIKLNNKDTKL